MAMAGPRPGTAPRLAADGNAGSAWRRWWPYAAILLAAFAIRAPTFGDPVLGVDEQFYLLVGDRMLHGQLPYVDLWDRKPIGLFLAYAGFRLLGGVGIVQYQVAATLCAAATAALIHAIARRGAGPAGALVAAVAYLLQLMTLHGGGGQAPVLYNALTAAAAYATYRANDSMDPRRITRLALGAMAAMGLAIQFKYTPLVEGAFFGCWFLYRLRRSESSLASLSGIAAAMIAVALAPTLAAIAAYAAAGNLDAFVQANFLSVFRRAHFPSETRTTEAQFVLFFAASTILLAPIALWRTWRTRAGRGPDDRMLTIGWLAAALGGFGMLGDFYGFYFITPLLPLMVLIAPLIRASAGGIAAAAVLLVWPALAMPSYRVQTRADRQATQALAAAVRPYVGDRCLYVYDGPPILYLLTHACAPTPYLYPGHLTNPTEAPALGVDPTREEARLLATRPGAIVTADRPVVPVIAPGPQRLLAAALARNYVLAARVRFPERMFSVWALRPAPPRTAARATLPL